MLFVKQLKSPVAMCEPVAVWSKALPILIIQASLFVTRVRIKIDQYISYVLNHYCVLHMGIH